MSRRVTFLMLLLVLLVAPAVNAWCATVCLAEAISSGCAHGLQPSDDLPMQKAAPVASFTPTLFPLAAHTSLRAPEIPTQTPAQRTPLRI